MQIKIKVPKVKMVVPARPEQPESAAPAPLQAVASPGPENKLTKTPIEPQLKTVHITRSNAAQSPLPTKPKVVAIPPPASPAVAKPVTLSPVPESLTPEFRAAPEQSPVVQQSDPASTPVPVLQTPEAPVCVPTSQRKMTITQPKKAAVNPKPVFKIAAKPASAEKPSDFHEIELKSPETPAVVKFKLAPKVKTTMSAGSASGAAPAVAKKPLVPNESTPRSEVTAAAPEEAQTPVAQSGMAQGKPEPAPTAPVPPSPIAEINKAEGAFKFYCPACQQKLGAKMDWQGRSIVCPACKKTIAIPAL